MKSLQGAPFLTAIFFLYVVLGMVFLIAGDVVPKGSLSPFLTSLLPVDWFSYFTCLVVLRSLRSCELVCGRMRIAVVVLLSYILDVVVRILVGRTVELKGVGPIATMTALFPVYCVMFPCVKTRFLGVNEKIFLLVLLMSNVLWFGVETLISFGCGFVTFVCMLNSIVPINKKE